MAFFRLLPAATALLLAADWQRPPFAYDVDRERPVFGAGTAIREGPVRVTGNCVGRGSRELVGYARGG